MTISTTTDFTANLLADIGQSVTRTPVTKTVDFRGDQTLTEGSSEVITAHIHIDQEEEVREAQGQIIRVIGYIMVGPSQTLNRDDKITFNSVDYRVHSVYTEVALNTLVYKYADLYIL